MSGLAPWLAALVLAQAEPAPPAAERPAQVTAPPDEGAPAGTGPADEAPAAEPETTAAPTSPSTPAQAPAAAPTRTPAAAPAPTASPSPTSDRPEPSDGARDRLREPAPAPPLLDPAATRAGSSPPPPRPEPPRAAGSPVPAPAPLPRPAAAPGAAGAPARGAPATERDRVALVARTFLEALAAGDANALAAASSERFSFDGETQSGRDTVRSTWRAILAGRPGPAPAVGGVEVLRSEEAIARHGKPPARVAPLARPDTYVAFGDVGGRTVVLFLAREGGRLAVLGLHD